MKKTKFIPLLVCVVVVAVITILYFYLIYPKKEDLKSVTRTNSNFQLQIDTLQSKIKALEGTDVGNLYNQFNIRKRLPENRAVDELLLDLEEVEYVSGTRINSVNFNSYDSLVNTSDYTDPNAPKTEEGQTEEGQTNQEGQATEQTTDSEQQNKETTNGEGQTNNGEGQEAQTQAAPVTTIDLATLPPNLKMITFNLEVEAPNEERLMHFLKEVENIERVMHVDTLNFSLLGEEQQYQVDASKIVKATILLTTFYYE